MHTIYRGLILIVCLAVAIECQGAGGSHFSGGGFSGGIIFHGSSSSCTGRYCSSGGIIFAIIIGVLAGIALVIFGIYCFIKCRRTQPLSPNAVYVANGTSGKAAEEKYDISIFKSGYWNSRYFQYGKWHGPYQFSLSFITHSMEVTGSGSDDVGTFTIDGTYSTKTNRIGLTKTYRASTGNPFENFGHKVTIQLEWNANNHQFEGKWHVQTNRYQGEGKFELKCDEQQQLPVYEKV